jgi:hypothetical protein
VLVLKRTCVAYGAVGDASCVVVFQGLSAAGTVTRYGMKEIMLRQLELESWCRNRDK